jgi:peptidoglycan/LPS O-acetylase OafA/YrhL
MQGRLEEINGLRGLAILAVVWHHMAWAVLPNGAPTFLGHSIHIVVANGWTGVNMFFVLSGFVLYLPYASGKRQICTLSDVIEFYKHRFFRLAPAYYLSAFVVVAFAYKTAGYGTREAIGVVTGTYIFQPDLYSPSLNWALWSIGTEALFSAVFPALVALGRRLGIGRLALLLVLFALTVRISTCFIMPPHYGPEWIQDALLAGRIDEFAIGMYAAKLYVERKLPKPGPHLLVAGVILLAAALHLYEGAQTGRLPVLAMAFSNNLLDAGFALFLVHAVAGGSMAARVLRFRPLQVAGMACYSIYLWHLPLINAFGIHRGMADRGVILIFLGALILIAGMSYRYVEFRSTKDWRQLFLIGARRTPQRIARQGE